MISRYSVKRPYTVVVAVVLVIILGVVSFLNMKTDLLPDMTLPYAIVMTTYPGASPEEVESMVTKPVEQAMATISNIENVTSVSSENVSQVYLNLPRVPIWTQSPLKCGKVWTRSKVTGMMPWEVR